MKLKKSVWTTSFEIWMFLHPKTDNVWRRDWVEILILMVRKGLSDYCKKNFKWGASICVSTLTKIWIFSNRHFPFEISSTTDKRPHKQLNQNIMRCWKIQILSNVKVILEHSNLRFQLNWSTWISVKLYWSVLLFFIYLCLRLCWTEIIFN